MSDSAAAFVASLAAQQQINSRAAVACEALLVYDFFLTRQREYTLVWQQPWGGGKVLYLVIRYLALVDLPFIVYQQVTWVPSSGSCLFAVQWSEWSSLLAGFLAYVVLSLRTWAIWDRARWCGALLVVLTLAIIAVALRYEVLVTTSYEYQTQREVQGCTIISSPSGPLQPLMYVMTGYETVIFLLTLLLGLRHLRGKSARISSVLYRDALIASLCFFGVLIVGLSITTRSPEWSSVLSIIFRTLQAILPARIILNIREAAYSLDAWDVTLEERSTTVSFAMREDPASQASD